MKASAFKERCLAMRDKFEEMINSEPTVYGYAGFTELMMEFRHLVYAFDCNLPLNKTLDAPNALTILSPYMGQDAHAESVKRIRSYMDFFIKYIEGYCE